MNYNQEYCSPFKGKNNIWMKLEHIGRYLFAQNFLKGKGCAAIADVACGDGYGSNYLTSVSKKVYAVDRKFSYFNKQYLDNKKIRFLNLDLNLEKSYDELNELDAIVSFETIEHLQNPNLFLNKLYEKLKNNGWLILSFPNKEYERFDENGKNKDIFHINVFDRVELEKLFLKVGFKIDKVLGQGLCNSLVSANSSLVKSGVLKQKNVDNCFNYDETSLETLARLVAYPNENDVKDSYSFTYVLRK